MMSREVLLVGTKPDIRSYRKHILSLTFCYLIPHADLLQTLSESPTLYLLFYADATPVRARLAVYSSLGVTLHALRPSATIDEKGKPSNVQSQVVFQIDQERIRCHTTGLCSTPIKRNTGRHMEAAYQNQQTHTQLVVNLGTEETPLSFILRCCSPTEAVAGLLANMNFRRLLSTPQLIGC